MSEYNKALVVGFLVSLSGFGMLASIGSIIYSAGHHSFAVIIGEAVSTILLAIVSHKASQKHKAMEQALGLPPIPDGRW